MYGLIGKMLSVEGAREELLQTMLDGMREMPGCLSYVIARDPTDPNALWITEVGKSRERHQASLQLQAVQETIAKARPLITGFGERFETEPVGGYGLQAA